VRRHLAAALWQRRLIGDMKPLTLVAVRLLRLARRRRAGATRPRARGRHLIGDAAGSSSTAAARRADGPVADAALAAGAQVSA
jgi:hypothetical protein